MSKLKLLISSLIIALPLASITVLSGCASVTSQPSVGKYQCANHCSNKITNSIISRINANSGLSALPIEVSTCHHVVTLSGTVYNQQQLHDVLYIASHTRHVALVRTGILVRDPFVNH